MSIKFFNFYGHQVSQLQAEALEEYSKLTEVNGNPKRRDFFYKGEVYVISYYKTSGETESQIINSLLPEGKKFSIVETETVFGNYRLEKSKAFSSTGVWVAMRNDLYDPLGNNVATERIKDILNGIPEYTDTRKYYYDPSINPDTFLFESFFKADGSFDHIYYNSLHTNPDEQDSEVFSNTPQDIQTLRDITGISQQLADYYVVPNVIP